MQDPVAYVSMLGIEPKIWTLIDIVRLGPEYQELDCIPVIEFASNSSVVPSFSVYSD